MNKLIYKIVETSISLLVVKSSTYYQYIWHLFILPREGEWWATSWMHIIVVHKYNHKAFNNVYTNAH